MIEYEQDVRARQHFHSKAAIYTGLLLGAVFLLIARGIPWASLGMPTHVMGRPLFSDPGATQYLVTGIVQMIVAICYAFIISGIIFGLRTMQAILLGGVVGLGLYGLNYLVFNFLLTNAPPSSEGNALISHVAFGFIAAGAYKGFSVPKAVPVDDVR
jgi:hypothetical protein